MKLFVVAIAFLTRIPASAHGEFSAADVGKAARWFPLVGALIGVVCLLTSLGLSSVLPALVIAVVIVAVEALLTGALHLDGLADMADGFGGGRSREEILLIMRDHAIGSYGAVALILLVLIKLTTLAGLIERRRLAPYLIIAPMLARWSTVLLNCLLPYARRSESEGRKPAGVVTDFIGFREAMVATVTSLVITLGLLGWQGLIYCFAVIVASAVSARICHSHIGGVTGDTLGANTEICEAVVLLVALGWGK